MPYKNRRRGNLAGSIQMNRDASPASTDSLCTSPVSGSMLSVVRCGRSRMRSDSYVVFQPFSRAIQKMVPTCRSRGGEPVMASHRSRVLRASYVLCRWLHWSNSANPSAEPSVADQRAMPTLFHASHESKRPSFGRARIASCSASRSICPCWYPILSSRVAGVIGRSSGCAAGACA